MDVRRERGRRERRAGERSPASRETGHLELPAPVYRMLEVVGVVTEPRRRPYRVLPVGLDDDFKNYVRCYRREAVGRETEGAATAVYVGYLKLPGGRTGTPQAVDSPRRVVPFLSGTWDQRAVTTLRSRPDAFPSGSTEYVNYARQMSWSISRGYPWGPTFARSVSAVPSPDVRRRLEVLVPRFGVVDESLAPLLPLQQPVSLFGGSAVRWASGVAGDWEAEDAYLRTRRYITEWDLPIDDEDRTISLWGEYYRRLPRDERARASRRTVDAWWDSVRWLLADPGTVGRSAEAAGPAVLGGDDAEQGRPRLICRDEEPEDYRPEGSVGGEYPADEVVDFGADFPVVRPSSSEDDGYDDETASDDESAE